MKIEKEFITSVSGKCFEVDVSNGTCRKFGYWHGEAIIHDSAGKGVVAGVAPATDRVTSQDVLWCKFMIMAGGLYISHQETTLRDVSNIMSLNTIATNTSISNIYRLRWLSFFKKILKWFIKLKYLLNKILEYKKLCHSERLSGAKKLLYLLIVILLKQPNVKPR
ncbi:hypothetical protein KAS41_02525 [Candidatus Parcubacteria bacterium]|nr:hypothetical protein [Candidatus Parcubacteria bacterium]